MSEREEYTPDTGAVRAAYARAMRQAFIASTSEHIEEFDRWLAAHDRALREQIARAVEERREHFIAETTLTLGGLPAWTDAYLNGLDDAIDVARGEDQTDE